MNNLIAKNFKAFRSSIVLDCQDEENILIYGENGSGKSSLFDAFRLYYFKQKIFDEQIPANIVEGRDEEEEAVINSFSFDKTNDLMVLSIAGVSHDVYDQNCDDQVFLLSYADLHPNSQEDDSINIGKLIKTAYLKCSNSVGDWFDFEAERLIIQETNKVLKNIFYMEDLILSPSLTQDGNCSLELQDRVAPKKEKLSCYFNEASIHLVRFIVLMESVAFVRDPQKHSLLVLDDCFNSLDAPNRTFMMRYLFNKANGMQKVIMTHNLSYYNLMSHVLTTEHDSELWKKYILSKVDGEYQLTKEDIVGSVQEIMDKRQQGYYADSIQLGNAIRQQFEILVCRLSMLCNIGAMPETKDLLDKLCSPNHDIYLSVDGNHNAKTASDLVGEIYSNVTNGNYHNLQRRLKDKIDNYRANDILAPLIPVLKELRLLQKVALHQASHGHTGLPPIQSKEYNVSLALLKKIEDAINSITRDDMSTL